mmetsp:Transcript_18510/g.45429  ORF Transcript_18510/g.45429 Transcript_18510/m.45429 type:complete len:201 (+) Transcript_18510:657-1259(+)
MDRISRPATHPRTHRASVLAGAPHPRGRDAQEGIPRELPDAHERDLRVLGNTTEVDRLPHWPELKLSTCHIHNGAVPHGYSPSPRVPSELALPYQHGRVGRRPPHERVGERLEEEQEHPVRPAAEPHDVAREHYLQVMQPYLEPHGVHHHAYACSREDLLEVDLPASVLQHLREQVRQAEAQRARGHVAHHTVPREPGGD